MIHSLSGGVLADGEVYTFAKVDVAGTPCWYLAPRKVEAGNKVLGVVVRTENCTRQTAPVPVGRAKNILRIL